VTTGARRGLEEVTALRCVSVWKERRRQEYAYDTGWCRTATNSLHITAVGKVFFEVAALIGVSAKAIKVRTSSLVVSLPSLIGVVTAMFKGCDSPAVHP
jgi:hypothetical protein